MLQIGKTQINLPETFCCPITPTNDDGLIKNDIWLGFVAYDGVTSNITSNYVLYYSNATSTERSGSGILSMYSVIFPWHGSQVPGICWSWLPSDLQYNMVSLMVRIPPSS